MSYPQQRSLKVLFHSSLSLAFSPKSLSHTHTHSRWHSSRNGNQSSSSRRDNARLSWQAAKATFVGGITSPASLLPLQPTTSPPFPPPGRCLIASEKPRQIRQLAKGAQGGIFIYFFFYVRPAQAQGTGHREGGFHITMLHMALREKEKGSNANC